MHTNSFESLQKQRAGEGLDPVKCVYPPPPPVIYNCPFQGGTPVVVPQCYMLLCYVCMYMVFINMVTGYQLSIMLPVLFCFVI